MGALFAMVPPWAGGALGTGLLVIVFFRYISLGSMTGALFAAVATLALAAAGKEPWEYFAYAAVVVSTIIWQHRDNVRRLMHGEERRITQRGERRSEGNA